MQPDATRAVLSRAAAAVAAGQPVPTEDSPWLAAVLAALADGLTLPTASAAATRRLRDDMLREIRRRHFLHLQPTAVRDEIALVIFRYEASSWRVDRHKSECPYTSASIRYDIWHLLRLGVEIPRSRRLFDILTAMQPDPISIA